MKFLRITSALLLSALPLPAQIVGGGGASAAALASKRSRVASTYDNFGRLLGSDGPISGSPQVGSPWRWNTASGVAPHVVNGALVGNPSSELFYFGNEVAEGINSIQFDIETSGGGGASYALQTIAVSSAPFMDFSGTYLDLPANMLHIQFGTSGFLDAGFSASGGANFEKMALSGVSFPNQGIYPYSENPLNEIVAGTRSTLTLSFSGADLLINFLGRNYVFRHPFATNSLVFSGQPANNETWSVGGVTYTFKSGSVSAANQILIGGSLAVTIANSRNAINAVSEVTNTTYGSGTVVNPLAASDALAGTTISLYARKGGAVGNAVAVSESIANASIAKAGGFLTGGERTPITAMGVPKHWFWEAANSPSSVRQNIKLHGVAINDPAPLDTPSTVISKLSTSGVATFGMGQMVNEKFKAGNAASALSEANYPANTKVLAVGSIAAEANFIQYAPANGKNHRYAVVDGRGIGTAVSSTSTAGLGTFATLMSGVGGGVSSFAADDWGWEHMIVTGYFPNTNSKILQITANTEGTVVYQSETISSSGLFTLTLSTHNKAAYPLMMVVGKLEYVTGGTVTTPVSGTTPGIHYRTIGGTNVEERSVGRSNFARAMDLKAATTGAGDVVIISAVTSAAIRP